MIKRFIALILLLPILAAAVNYPVPQGFVNDFANIIPDAEESTLESALRVYEKKTMIEIAVVTTPSLEGSDIREWSINLASKWGIGKKGADNGLLIVVAPNERDYAIEVGYGLEPFLPDVLANRLARESLPDAFRAGQYGQGLIRLVAGITKTIGEGTPEERAKVLAEMQAAKQRQADESARKFRYFVSVLIIGFLMSALVFGIYWLIVSIKKALRERARKEALRLQVASQLEDLERVFAAISPSFILGQHAGKVPLWMGTKVSEYERQATHYSGRVASLKGDVTSLVLHDPDAALLQVKEMASAIGLFKQYVLELASVDTSIEQFRARVATSVAESTGRVTAVKAAVKAMTTNGYRLPSSLLRIQEELIQEAETLKIALSHRGSGVVDRSDVVDQLSLGLREKAGRALEAVHLIGETRKGVETRLPRLIARWEALQRSQETAERVMTDLKKTTPQRVWQDHVRQLLQVPQSLRVVEDLLAGARKANSMTEQRFETAQKNVAEADQLLAMAEGSVASVTNLKSELQQAEAGYPASLQQVEAVIVKVEKAIRTGDVNYGAKQDLATAKSELLSAQRAKGSSPADWLMARSCLEKALKAGQAALRRSNSDIADATARRKRAAAASSVAASSISIGGSSSSSSSGFGGFGGGGFGGGGTSGKW